MSEPFFPNKTPDTMAIEAKFRRLVSPLSEAFRLHLYGIFTRLHSDLVNTQFEITDEFILANQCGYTIAFPRPLPLIKYAHIACGYEEWLAHKYALPGFVEVEPGDVVIDCGAYVGGFSLSACKIATTVHMFEPDITNYQCIRKNFHHITNTIINQMGLYDADGELLLNISESSVEHSFLTPDNGKVLKREAVTVSRLETYCIEKGIQTPDFVKIEAEGAEIEVFDGLGKLSPPKLAIDVSPERDGKSPATELNDRLNNIGYRTRQRGYVLFAHL